LPTGIDLDALEKLSVWPAAATPAATDFRMNLLDSVFITTTPIVFLLFRLAY